MGRPDGNPADRRKHVEELFVGLSQVIDQGLLFLGVQLSAIIDHPVNGGFPLGGSLVGRGDPGGGVANSAPLLHQGCTIEGGAG